MYCGDITELLLMKKDLLNFVMWSGVTLTIKWIINNEDKMRSI